jgi:hypothetical protein
MSDLLPSRFCREEKRNTNSTYALINYKLRHLQNSYSIFACYNNYLDPWLHFHVGRLVGRFIGRFFCTERRVFLQLNFLRAAAQRPPREL